MIRRGLARDPRERFPGILEFAAALDIVLSSAAPGTPDAYEETTDMMRTKTAKDIMSALSVASPDYANLVEVVRPGRGLRCRRQKPPPAISCPWKRARRPADGRRHHRRGGAGPGAPA